MRININSLTYAYVNKLVIDNLTFSLKSGEFLLIRGRNGTGKTTFLKCLLKILKIDNNMILLDDIDINRFRKFNNVGYVPQKSEFNFEFPITVEELLTCAYKGKRDDYFYSIIDKLEIKNLYKQNINNLSGGQIQKVFVARALLNKPKLLILDEPTVGIDLDSVESIHDILKQLKEQEITIILVTHDYNFCTDLADMTLIFNENANYEFKGKSV